MESTYQRGVIKMHLWSYPRTQRIIVKQRGKGKWRIESLNNIRTITGAISWVTLNRNGAHKIEKPRSVVLKNGGTFGKNLNGALKLLKGLIKWKFEIYSAELNLETSRTMEGEEKGFPCFYTWTLTFEKIWNGCWKSWQSFWVFFQSGKHWWTPGSTEIDRAWKTLGSRHSRASENGSMRYGTFSSCSQSWGRYMHVIIWADQEHGQQGNTLSLLNTCQLPPCHVKFWVTSHKFTPAL